MSSQPVLAVIPARGGSKGIPRKNVRFIAGKPLICYAINNAGQSRHIDKVVISTDDEEIAHIAELNGCEVVMRPAELAADDVPLDPVIHHAVNQIERTHNIKFSVVVTLQPTSPLLSPETMDRALFKFFDEGCDTLISVVDDRHLSWTRNEQGYTPMYEKRVNRQLLPPNFRETGGILITRRAYVTETSRFGPKIDLFEVDLKESIDIDTYMDWWTADKLLHRRRILFRVDGYKEIGLGHIYRTLLLAGRLIDHDVLFVTRAEHDLGADLIRKSFYPVRIFHTDRELEEILKDFKPDIFINDILDTEPGSIQKLIQAGYFVVNFEDMGDGARYAHLVINALYEKRLPLDNCYWGKDYYCLREEFLLLPPKEISRDVRNILITFGGTDPHDYTGRVLKIIDSLKTKDISVTIVTGIGYPTGRQLEETAASLHLDVEIVQDTRTISKYMHRADIVFTSAGRTVFEVAAVGTPIIVMAQNNRELHHTFARTDNGIINLGLGYEVTDKEIKETLISMMEDQALRQKCSRLMLNNNLRRGMENVINLIFEAYKANKEQTK